MDLVFLHGGGQGGWIWGETIAAMKVQQPGAHRYLPLDVPGCGDKRGRDTSSITFSEIIAELTDDILAAGMRDVVLIGHSQAGTTMPHIVAGRPDLFSRLLYVSCIAPELGATMSESFARIHAGRHTEVADRLGNPDLTSLDQARLMFCNDMSDEEGDVFLAKLMKDKWPESSRTHADWRYDHLDKIPSSYVICLQDRALPADAQETFATRFHADRAVRIDAGHQAQNTRPYGLAEILLAEIAG